MMLELVKGCVVKVKAGRDKDKFFVVVDFNDKEAFICDGRRRKVSKPKKKNIRHLALTSTVVSPEDMTCDKRIRLALNKFLKV